VDYKPDEGRYDLHISNVSYARDDGRFECRLKMSGTGKDIHSQAYQVTVLTPPGPPKIGPSHNPTMTEGKPFDLTCSTKGGSPNPVIRSVHIDFQFLFPFSLKVINLTKTLNCSDGFVKDNPNR
jgi:echinoid protein